MQKLYNIFNLEYKALTNVHYLHYRITSTTRSPYGGYSIGKMYTGSMKSTMYPVERNDPIYHEIWEHLIESIGSRVIKWEESCAKDFRNIYP